MNQSKRIAEFAGRFYPKTEQEIKLLLERITTCEKSAINTHLSKKKLLGAIVPHAGFIYSAYQAVHAYEILKKHKTKFDTFVIINPNHTGMGNNALNLSSSTNWETPMGNVPVDIEFAKAMGIEFNNNAHLKEHSGEVQLPLLSYFLPYSFKIVVITMNIQNPNIALQLASSISKAKEKTNRNIFVLASSDFSHFETPESGFKKDQYLIDEILDLNTNQLYLQVKKHDVSICGYGPIMALIEYQKQQSKAPKIELLKRGHSGEISPSDQVVDYVSFLCFE